MATIYKSFVVNAAPDDVWDALRDFDHLHTRLVRGFVVACRSDGKLREVEFANGMKAREQLLGIDESARRLAYTVVGGRAAYHHASAQVFTEGVHTRFVWTTDVLPDELAAPIAAMMDQGSLSIQRTLEDDAG